MRLLISEDKNQLGNCINEQFASFCMKTDIIDKIENIKNITVGNEYQNYGGA